MGFYIGLEPSQPSCYTRGMSRLEMLEREIQSLSQEELSAFDRWFAEFKAEQWDKQIEADAKAGKLDKLANEAIAQFRQGNFKKL